MHMYIEGLTLPMIKFDGTCVMTSVNRSEKAGSCGQGQLASDIKQQQAGVVLVVGQAERFRYAHQLRASNVVAITGYLLVSLSQMYEVGILHDVQQEQ